MWCCWLLMPSFDVGYEKGGAEGIGDGKAAKHPARLGKKDQRCVKDRVLRYDTWQFYLYAIFDCFFYARNSVAIKAIAVGALTVPREWQYFASQRRSLSRGRRFL